MCFDAITHVTDKDAQEPRNLDCAEVKGPWERETTRALM